MGVRCTLFEKTHLKLYLSTLDSGCLPSISRVGLATLLAAKAFFRLNNGSCLGNETAALLAGDQIYSYFDFFGRLRSKEKCFDFRFGDPVYDISGNTDGDQFNHKTH